MQKQSTTKEVFLKTLKKDLDKAFKKGWKAFAKHNEYELIKDYFNELGTSGFFEEKFRGKIPNPAHDYAVKSMSMYTIPVFLQYGVVLDQFFPGDFLRSTGEKMKTKLGEYEHRNFHVTAWREGAPLADLTITISHVRGKFVFPKPPFVTIKKIYK
jgi:hypothetical protein